MFYEKATFRILGEEQQRSLLNGPDEEVQKSQNSLEEYVVIPLSEDPSFIDDPKQAYLLELLAARDALSHHNTARAKIHLLSALELNAEVQAEKGPYGKRIKP